VKWSAGDIPSLAVVFYSIAHAQAHRKQFGQLTVNLQDLGSIRRRKFRTAIKAVR
jgi:hypothetical protein